MAYNAVISTQCHLFRLALSFFLPGPDEDALKHAAPCCETQREHRRMFRIHFAAPALFLMGVGQEAVRCMKSWAANATRAIERFFLVFAKDVLCTNSGFDVLAQASHYWPLGTVEGIHELRDTNGDIVEGMVNKGICIPDPTGVMFLLFGSYQNSCIINPELCEPEGVTFSFFWKTKTQQPNSPPAYGDQVLSNGFKISFSEGKGSVELYNHQHSWKWEASFIPSGPYWTHVLFTWKSQDGLKVYVNGTLHTTDPNGKVSYSYADSSSNMLTGSEGDQTGRYVNGVFDEFIIWERVLTPKEVEQYFTAAVGDQPLLSSTAPWGQQATETVPMPSRNAYRPIIVNLTEERGNFLYPGAMLDYLENISLALPNESLSAETAFNLTEAFLQTVEDVLSLPSWIETVETAPFAGALVETVDSVMSHVARNLGGSPSGVAFEGASSVADYSLAKKPLQLLNVSHYRFPLQGQSYISIPGEAFQAKAWITIVGLLYHMMHQYFHSIKPMETKIPEAASCKDCMISAASYLISLKVEPPPTLSPNLSGSPLITIHLTHKLHPLQWSESASRWQCGSAAVRH
ncbi:PREDICTED: adhesion G-protein coupled receptor D1 [Gekko japonicus]|uniref:Adhesion G-protein coupled receptor D1 n=1 Tax=Gekko japonicus TaxID=146911 RepID=A0ABM1KI13_GEKJA|nr:PREDICTED: adhesion G-protein coupled receptor D1 [Gekko japonicus]